MIDNKIKTKFVKFTPGTIIRNIGSKRVWMVTENYGEYVSVVQTNLIMNPDEWEIIKREFKKS